MLHKAFWADCNFSVNEITPQFVSFCLLFQDHVLSVQLVRTLRNSWKLTIVENLPSFLVQKHCDFHARIPYRIHVRDRGENFGQNGWKFFVFFVCLSMHGQNWSQFCVWDHVALNEHKLLMQLNLRVVNFSQSSAQRRCIFEFEGYYLEAVFVSNLVDFFDGFNGSLYHPRILIWHHNHLLDVVLGQKLKLIKDKGHIG